MWQRTRQILEMIRFSHTIFALPFALLAAVMAWRLPIDESGTRVVFDPIDLFGIIACMVTARSAAMAFNRLVDRDIDAANPRTKNRHLAAGTLNPGPVIAFTIASSLIFIASTLLFLPNYLPLVMSVPILLFIFAYSYTKRFTSLAHFWLGISLMLAPVAAWIAVRGEAVIANPWDLTPVIVIGLAVFFWVAGFDIIYACQDYDFDVSAKLKSVPAWLGVTNALRVAAACHAVMVGLLITLPFCGKLANIPIPFGWIYWAGIAAVAALLIYEHIVVKPNDLTRVNVAFFNINAIVSIGLLAIVVVDLWV